MFETKRLTRLLAVVAFLSFAARVEAKIVYTPVNATLSGSGHFAIDVNHDGIRDFYIQATSAPIYCGTGGGGIGGKVTITPATGNGVVANGTYALRLGRN